HGEIAASRHQADPAPGAVVGDDELTVIAFEVQSAQRRAPAARRLLEGLAPPRNAETPERGIERSRIAQSMEPYARHDHAGLLEGLKVFPRRTAGGLVEA